MNTELTNIKIKSWIHTMESVERTKRDLSSVECLLINTTNDLGRYLCPKDAKVDEVFNIWHGNGILKVTKKSANDYEVSWRMKPTLDK